MGKIGSRSRLCAARDVSARRIGANGHPSLHRMNGDARNEAILNECRSVSSQHGDLRNADGSLNARRNGIVGYRNFVLLFAVVGFASALSSQTISPERQVLLKRKGALLQEIKTYEQKKKEAQNTLTQANSLRDMAAAANRGDQASIYTQAAGVAAKTIEAADNGTAADRRRVEAIDQALSWPESDKPRAVATLVRGQVMKETPAGRVPFDPAKPLQLGDRLSLGEDGFVELQLENGSAIQLGPKTDFLYDRDDRGTYYKLRQGTLHKVTAIMGVLGLNDQSTYRGAQCIVAVRGTEFTFEVSGNEEALTVLEGEIEVDPGAGRDKVSLRAGQELAVPRTGAVGHPVAFDPSSVHRWWNP